MASKSLVSGLPLLRCGSSCTRQLQLFLFPLASHSAVPGLKQDLGHAMMMCTSRHSNKADPGLPSQARQRPAEAVDTLHARTDGDSVDVAVNKEGWRGGVRVQNRGLVGWLKGWN